MNMFFLGVKVPGTQEVLVQLGLLWRWMSECRGGSGRGGLFRVGCCGSLRVFV